jgi:hypothetical protein
MNSKLFGAFLVLAISSTTLVAVENLYKIEKLYAEKKALNGKNIAVKGVVLKISKGIMGKDWIHIQDNSVKSKTKKRYKVIFTAKKSSLSDDIQIGDMVLAKGTLKADVDLGFGYFYDVLIEKSSFENLKSNPKYY